MDKRHVESYDSLALLLDALISDREIDWDAFYSAEQPRAPFVCHYPDENLVEWIRDGLIAKQGKCLELGCGNGRNAIWLASKGWHVTAVDLSPVAVGQALDRAKELGVEVDFRAKSIFDESTEQDYFDLVYDSGCFHHVSPHRRMEYVELVNRSLAPGGVLGLTCFNERGGSDKSDLDVYRERRMFGGLAYGVDEIRRLFEGHFQIETSRRMKSVDPGMELFGVDIVSVYLMRLVS